MPTILVHSYRRNGKRVASYRRHVPGGKGEFKRLQKSVARGYVGKKVPKKYQHLYGKRYSKTEAMQVGAKVAGSRLR